MFLSDCVHLAVRLHERLAEAARPAALDRADGEHDVAGRFVSLFLLAALLIPFFVLVFLVTGYPEAGAVLVPVGAVMLSCLWIYKKTGNTRIARDIFLGALFLFLMWESYYFKSLYSPGFVWLIAIPVVSILLGSIRAAMIWFTICMASIAVSFVLLVPTGEWIDLESGAFRSLHTISIAGMILAIFIFVVMVDAARRKAYQNLEQANKAVETLAETDELTGLFNRRAFERKFSRRMQGGAAQEEVALLVADLDGFKDVNDTYGHDIGDLLIKRVAAGLRTLSFNNKATAARLGGDEFAVLLWGAGARERAMELAQQALELMGRPIDVAGLRADIGVSIGMAATRASMESTELLRQADVAMYEAKKRGKNQLCCYDRALDVKKLQRRALAEDLARAIETGAIRVRYQPIVEAKTRQITAVEALARWTKENGPAISPEEFIPIAEESGLIDRLGMHVLRTACQDAALWPRLKLSVNLSPLQFKNPTLVKDILGILKQTRLAPERLELELTERYLIEHRERALPLMEDLRAAGISIALDDFGTGYSSIGYLREYRFNRVKIDKSLVKGIERDPSVQSTIQAIAVLARSLSLNLTAEGVESEAEAGLLRLAGCSDMQGFLFGMPQSAESITKLLANGNGLEAGSTSRQASI